MHDQKRDEYKARLNNDVISSKLSQKALQWNTLTNELQKRRKGILQHDDIQIENTLQAIEKLLSVNPDPSNLWNYRREILEMKIGKGTSCNSDEWIHQEQLVTQKALESNPKSYSAWFHRKWSIRRFIQKVSEAEIEFRSKSDLILNGELLLCAEFLKLDERNFHCWNYRRYIVGCMMDIAIISDEPNIREINNSYMNGAWRFVEFISESKSIPVIGAQMTTLKSSELQEKVQSLSHVSHDSLQQKFYEIIQSEFKFTYDKIADNFSNGSAFHYRSKLLPLMFLLRSSNVKGFDSQIKFELVREELEVIRNAYYTEPDDQTCWWYLKFILDWANPEMHKIQSMDSVEEYRELLFDEWTYIYELVEAEEGRCKWGLLAMHMISSILTGSNFHGVDWKKESQTCINKVKLLDSDRLNRYDQLHENQDSK